MTSPTATLAGKRALVMGGSRGIGASIVDRMAAQGAAVAFTYQSSRERADALADGIAETGGTAIALHADSADAAQVASAVDDAARRLGGLDILVNNAGVGYISDIESFPLTEFDRMVAVNIQAVFVATQRALTHLDAGGRIITIGSINAERMPVPNMSVYAMTKAAVVGLTRGLARELGPRRITINVVQPGPIDTEMNPEDSQMSDSMRGFTALGSYGKPHDVASLVAYLAQPEAHYITGTAINIDGGYAA